METADNLNITLGQLSNGSLYPFLSTNPIWSTLPLNTTDPHLDFSANDGSILLAWATGNSNFTNAIPLISMLLQPNATIVPVYCTYPISGQYDPLVRWLFYLTLVVAVIGRKSTWLSSAALSTAIAYSTITAVHFFVLLGSYGWKAGGKEGTWDANNSQPYGDIDFFGLLGVLSTAGVMIAPIQTWSKTFRHHEARPVFILWALLIFASLIPALVLLRGFILGHWGIDTPPSIAYCIGTDPACQYEKLANPQTFTWQLYVKCNCLDFCSMLSPNAPLRDFTNMSADVQLQISRHAHLVHGRYEAFFIVVSVVWAVATAQGLLSIFWSMIGTEQLRNWMFLLFVGDVKVKELIRLIFNKPDVTEPDLLEPERMFPHNRFRVFVSLILPASIYLTALLGAVIYPITFITTIIVNELLVATYPVSEHSSAVGAWSSWVGALLVFVAAALTGGYDHWYELWVWIGLPQIKSREQKRLERLRLKKAERAQKPRHIKRSTNWILSKTSEFRNWLNDPVKASRKGIKDTLEEKGQKDETEMLNIPEQETTKTVE
jgi:hypothetical protein